jgi:hypothetical protein
MDTSGREPGFDGAVERGQGERWDGESLDEFLTQRRFVGYWVCCFLFPRCGCACAPATGVETKQSAISTQEKPTSLKRGGTEEAEEHKRLPELPKVPKNPN